MEMDHFWTIPASFELSCLFMGLPEFILPFGLKFLNIHGGLLCDILFTWPVQFDLYTFIFSKYLPILPPHLWSTPSLVSTKSLAYL